MRRIIACMIAVLSAFTVFGHNQADSVKVYFCLNQSQFDPEYGGNAASMEALVSKVREAADADNLDHITVRGYASPDGPASFNERLAKKRCEAIAEYIIAQTGIAPEKVLTIPEGIAWSELRRLVESSSDVPSRSRILEILDSGHSGTGDRASANEQNKRLKSLEGGLPYSWMLDNIYPQLRHSLAVAIYLKSGDGSEDAGSHTGIGDSIQETVPDGTAGNNAAQDSRKHSETEGSQDSDLAASGLTDVQGTVPADMPASGNTGNAPAVAEIPAAVPDTTGAAAALQRTDTTDTTAEDDTAEGSPAQDAGTVMIPAESITPDYRLAVKTNLLYYAALMPNVELEYLINKNWSVSAQWNIAWYGNEAKCKAYEISEIDTELRYWIRPRAPWRGLFVGLHTGGGWYDLENGGPGYMGEVLVTGASLGYSWPVGKRLVVSTEFGIGYVHTRYREYTPIDGHFVYQRTKSLDYFGPVMLKVSIGCRFWDRNKSKWRKSDHEE